MATILTDSSKPFKAKITGEKGASGELSSSQAAVKDNLYNKKYTVWCADGDVCQLPVGSKGFASGEDIILTPKTKVSVTGSSDVGVNLKVGNNLEVGHNAYVASDLNVGGKLNVGSGMAIEGATISNTGRMHISGGENLYLLNKNGVIVGKEFGGNGNLVVEGNTAVGGRLDVGGDTQFNGVWANFIKIGDWILQQHPNGNLHLHKGNIEDWKGALTAEGGWYGRRGYSTA